jgi:hypothetical protein
MGSKASYTYDSVTGKWTKNSSTNSTSTGSSTKKTETKTTAKKTPTSKTTNQKKGNGDTTDKKYRDIEYCTLEGELSVVPNKETLKIRAGETITLYGVGSYLSGRYFVTNVTRTIDDNGFSITLTVIKTGFGDSIKKATSTKHKAKTKVKLKVNKSKDFKVGNKVKIIGEAVYSNANDGKKVPNYIKKKTLTISKLSEHEDKAYLKEIISWVYTKYLTRV